MGDFSEIKLRVSPELKVRLEGEARSAGISLNRYLQKN